MKVRILWQYGRYYAQIKKFGIWWTLNKHQDYDGYFETFKSTENYLKDFCQRRLLLKTSKKEVIYERIAELTEGNLIMKEKPFEW